VTQHESRGRRGEGRGKNYSELGDESEQTTGPPEVLQVKDRK